LPSTLNYAQILSALRQKREQIDEAITLIQQLAESDLSKPASLTGKTSTAHSRGTAPKRRQISAAGRKRIAEAAKRMWAARRAAGTTGAKKTGAKKAGSPKK
jgi:hypothetical protein